MGSQKPGPRALKTRRIRFALNPQRLERQASGPAIGASLTAQEVKRIRATPTLNRGLGNLKSSLEEPTHHPLGLGKSEHLPLLAGSAGEGHAPDHNEILNAVTIRVLQGGSAEGPEPKRVSLGQLRRPPPPRPPGVDVHKNTLQSAHSPEETQVKGRTMVLLAKARKQIEKAENQQVTRQLQKEEVAVDTKSLSKIRKQQKKQELGIHRAEEAEDTEELRRTQTADKHHRFMPHLEKDTVLKGKKIEPQSRHPPQAVCPTFVGEEGLGGKLQTPGQDKMQGKTASKETTALEGKAAGHRGQRPVVVNKPLLLSRREMQSLEMSAEFREREFNIRSKVHLHIQKPKEATVKSKWQPKERGWDPTIRGTPVVLRQRDRASHRGRTWQNKRPTCPKGKSSSHRGAS